MADTVEGGVSIAQSAKLGFQGNTRPLGNTPKTSNSGTEFDPGGGCSDNRGKFVNYTSPMPAGGVEHRMPLLYAKEAVPGLDTGVNSFRKISVCLGEKDGTDGNIWGAGDIG